MTKGDFGFRVKPTIDIAILWREILHVSKYIWYCIKRRVISNPILLPICNQARWTKTYLAVQMITGVIKKPMAILFSNLKYISTKVIGGLWSLNRFLDSFSRTLPLPVRLLRQSHHRNSTYHPSNDHIPAYIAIAMFPGLDVVPSNPVCIVSVLPERNQRVSQVNIYR